MPALTQGGRGIVHLVTLRGGSTSGGKQQGRTCGDHDLIDMARPRSVSRDEMQVQPLAGMRGNALQRGASIDADDFAGRPCLVIEVHP